MRSLCGVSARASLRIFLSTMLKSEDGAVHRTYRLDHSRGHPGRLSEQQLEQTGGARPLQHLATAHEPGNGHSDAVFGQMSKHCWTGRFENLDEDRLL